MRLMVFCLAIGAVSASNCDDKHSCPGTSTCCKMEDGAWGCCPLPEAVCCSKGDGCCPKGTTCDDKGEMCNQKFGSTFPMMKKTKARMNDEQEMEIENIVENRKVNENTLSIDWISLLNLKAASVKCADGGLCSDDNTCCPIGGGHYGCCPEKNGVCCDTDTCCPKGSKCSGDYCIREDKTVQLKLNKFRSATSKNKIRAIPMQKNNNNKDSSSSENSFLSQFGAGNTNCPGGKYYCPNGNTCCPRGGGQWGCCPMINAVCCNGDTCCPWGYACNGGSCIVQKAASIPFLRLILSKPSQMGSAIMMTSYEKEEEYGF